MAAMERVEPRNGQQRGQRGSKTGKGMVPSEPAADESAAEASSEGGELRRWRRRQVGRRCCASD